MIILSGRKGDILTAKDTPIKHRPKIFNLLQASHLPKEIAVIHCKGHQNKITQGNKYADKVAKVVTTSEDIFLGALIPSLPTELPTPKYAQEEIQWTSQHNTPTCQQDGSS